MGSAMRANMGLSKLHPCESWDVVAAILKLNWRRQILPVYKETKLPPLTRVWYLCAAAFRVWKKKRKKIAHPNSGHFPKKWAAIMMKSASPPAIRNRSQNSENQIRFNKVIIYITECCNKKLQNACNIGTRPHRAWFQQHIWHSDLIFV